jgi:hypothetical protein
MRHLVGDDAGFARACTSEDQTRPLHMVNRFELRKVEGR